MRSQDHPKHTLGTAKWPPQGVFCYLWVLINQVVSKCCQSCAIVLSQICRRPPTNDKHWSNIKVPMHSPSKESCESLLIGWFIDVIVVFITLGCMELLLGTQWAESYQAWPHFRTTPKTITVLQKILHQTYQNIWKCKNIYIYIYIFIYIYIEREM